MSEKLRKFIGDEIYNEMMHVIQKSIFLSHVDKTHFHFKIDGNMIQEWINKLKRERFIRDKIEINDEN